VNRQKPTEHRLRTYRRGDGEALISLFNRVYENFAGFVPRTLEYWSWCVLSHPDLSEEGIVVAINAGRVVGYAAIERSGNVVSNMSPEIITKSTCSFAQISKAFKNASKLISRSLRSRHAPIWQSPRCANLPKAIPQNVFFL